jgi:hypothetical protein
MVLQYYLEPMSQPAAGAEAGAPTAGARASTSRLGMVTRRVEQIPARDNTRGRSSTLPMTIPTSKISYPYQYPSGNG